LSSHLFPASRLFSYRARVVAFGVFATVTLAGHAHALLIQPTFDSSISGDANAVAAINTAINTIDGLYSDQVITHPRCIAVLALGA